MKISSNHYAFYITDHVTFIESSAKAHACTDGKIIVICLQVFFCSSTYCEGAYSVTIIHMFVISMYSFGVKIYIFWLSFVFRSFSRHDAYPFIAFIDHPQKEDE